MNAVNAKAGAVIGCLLGTAVGDALGLPYEALSRRRQARMYPEIRGHAFLFGRGMASDDTEHTCLVAQALIVSAGELRAFTKSLAWRLRFWLLGLPAGVGVATLRAILKLWMGFPAHRSGVFSAGNGPAMRSAVIGVCYGDDPEKMRALVAASTRITHTDPKAAFGALAVALAAHLAGNEGDAGLVPERYCRDLAILLGEQGNEFLDLVRRVAESVAAGQSTAAFAAELGLDHGVSGYSYHTVPVAIHACLRHPADFRAAILSVIRCGGDTDTLAAITGAVVGAAVSEPGIPAEWLRTMVEWPRTIAWIRRLGERLAEVSQSGEAERAPGVSAIGLFLRNLVFMLIVLVHGFRRLLPPY